MAKASIDCPIYYANIYGSDGTKYQLKDITTDLTVGQGKYELAERVRITFANVKVGDKQLQNFIKLKDRIYVYANTGDGAIEVFRGFVWDRSLRISSDVNETSLICYDRLMYLQESKDTFYVAKGSTTREVINNLAKKWGVTISYTYKSITHDKILYRSEYIADMLVDILDKVKKKTGVGYVIRCEKDVMVIEPECSNSTVYTIESKYNSAGISYNETMSGMITNVKITKSQGEDDNETYVTVTEVTGNTKQYGTLQDIIEVGDDEKLAEAKKEANQILKDKGKPQKDISVMAVDNPMIKKGHQVYIRSGILQNYYVVEGIEHDATSHLMSLEVKRFA